MRLKVLLVAAIFAISFMGFYSPAQAADGITPYGNIVTWAGWTMKDKDNNGTVGKSDTDYAQGQANPATTNIGVKGEKNGVEVRLEFGVKTNYEQFRARWAYASYKASNGLQLWFGNGLTPYSMVNGMDFRDSDAMALAGTCYDGWINQVRLHFMGAYISIMQPQTTGATYDNMLPKAAAGYEFKTDVFSAGVNGVFQQVKYDDAASARDGAKLNAWLLNAIFKGKFGPAYVNALAYYAVNPGDMGFNSYNGAKTGAPGANNKAVAIVDGWEDTTVYGGNVAAGFKIGDMAQINVGVGYEKCDNDTYAKADDFIAYFVNAQIFIQPNCFVVPTVKQVDFRKSQANAKEGKQTYVGAAFVASI